VPGAGSTYTGLPAVVDRSVNAELVNVIPTSNRTSLAIRNLTKYGKKSDESELKH